MLEVGRTLDLQNSVKRSIDGINNNGIVAGCVGGAALKIAENSWRVSHSLGVEPIGFIIIDQGSTSSVKAKMTEMKTTDVVVTFSEDPTSFKIFLY